MEFKSTVNLFILHKLIHTGNYFFIFIKHFFTFYRTLCKIHLGIQGLDKKFMIQLDRSKKMEVSHVRPNIEFMKR